MAEQRPGPETPLLSLVAQQAIDQDYTAAATRRIAAGGTPGRGGSHVVAAAAVLVFGLVVAMAAVQTEENADVDAASRRTLLARIEERSQLVSEQQARVSELEEINERLTDLHSRAGSRLQNRQSRLTRISAASGFRGVSGPGVRFVVEDNPDENYDMGRVRPSDIRMLVNALWQSGAEAVAVDGHRIGARSTISLSGIAVQIDSSPLAPPYRVEAIGDRRTLLADVYETTLGARFHLLSEDFGFQVTMENVETLRFGTAPPRHTRLRYAEVLDQGRQDREGEESR